MRTGAGHRVSPPLGRRWLGLLLSLLAGCATDRAQLQRALRAMPNLEPSAEVQASYLVAYPDLLEIAISQDVQIVGHYPVQADGCVKLGKSGRIRVEGKTIPVIESEVAERLHVSKEAIHVRVIEYASQLVYLNGEVVGMTRAIPYRGQETVVDLLRRAGGLLPGADLEDVYVVRSRVADGEQPEVYRVDLSAIILANDDATNILLQPFDQVFIGESRRCCVQKCLPPWLRPTYETLCGLRIPRR